jgi:hypothetical protein
MILQRKFFPSSPSAENRQSARLRGRSLLIATRSRHSGAAKAR